MSVRDEDRGKGMDVEAVTNPETIEGRIEHTSGYTLYPHGLDDLSDINAPSFAVQINWRGEYAGRSGGGWSVTRGSAELLASSVATGQKWDYPQRFRRWQYRFATFEEALAAARAVVDGVKVNGRTWAQWQERQAEVVDRDEINDPNGGIGTRADKGI